MPHPVPATSVARLIACSCSGYSTFQTNLLTIPSYVLFIIMNLSLAFTSKRVKERVGLSSLSSWWILIFLIVLITIPDNTNKWAKWAVLSLLQGYPVSPLFGSTCYCCGTVHVLFCSAGRDTAADPSQYPHPILVSMNSMNAGSVRTRTVASSVYNMAVQAASLIASNIYQPSACSLTRSPQPRAHTRRNLSL